MEDFDSLLHAVEQENQGKTPIRFPDQRREAQYNESQPAIHELTQAFVDAGIPIQVNSAFRTREEQARINPSVPNSYHPLGLALDIHPLPEYKTKMQEIAASKGFELIDESQKKNHYHFEPHQGSKIGGQTAATTSESFDSLLAQVESEQPSIGPVETNPEVATIGPAGGPGKEYIPPPVTWQDKVRAVGHGVTGFYQDLNQAAAGQPGVLGMPVPELTEEGERAKHAQEVAAKRAPGWNLGGTLLSSLIPLNPVATLGGVAGKPIKQVGEKGGQAIGNMYARQPLSSEVGAVIAEQTPSLTKGAVKAAAQKGVDKGQGLINQALKEHPQTFLSIKKIANDPELLQQAVKFENAGESSIAIKMFNKLVKLSNKPKLSGAEADELRKTFGELSFNPNKEPKNTAIAKFNKKIWMKIRNEMSDLFGVDYDKGLQLQDKNLGVVKAMSRLEKTPPPRGLGLLARGAAASFTGGLSELPNYAPTATSLAFLMNRGGKVGSAVAPAGSTFLASLLPKNKKQK